MLDAWDDDAFNIGNALLDGRDGRLRPRVARFVGQPDALLLLNTVELHPTWRGQGRGPLFAGLALRTLRGGSLVAATSPGLSSTCPEFVTSERAGGSHEYGRSSDSSRRLIVLSCARSLAARAAPTARLSAT